MSGGVSGDLAAGWESLASEETTRDAAGSPYNAQDCPMSLQMRKIQVSVVPAGGSNLARTSPGRCFAVQSLVPTPKLPNQNLHFHPSAG